MQIDRLEIKDGDTLVVRGKWDADKMVKLCRTIADQKKYGVAIVYLQEGETIETLSEKDMNKAGWYRKNGQN